jgi:hypothetical protein
MSRLGSYKNTAFSESQKFLVLDPSTSSASLVLASELVAYITPQIGSVRAESTRLSAENTDYKVGEIIQTSGATVVGSLAAVYLVVAGGAGDFPMLNGNDLLVLIGDDALRAQLISQTAGQGASLVSMKDGPTVEVAVNNRVIRVSSRTEMKAYDVPANYQFSLSEGGRSGNFVFRSSDLSAKVTGDPLEGIYVAPDSDPTGASGAFMRRYDGITESGGNSVLWFGATGDGTTNDHPPCQAALSASKNTHFPSPEVAYKITAPLILQGGQKINGDSKSDGVSRDADPLKKGIYGDMAVNGTELFQCGDGVDTTKRLMSFYDLYAYNNNGPVVKVRLSTEFAFYSCDLRSRFDHCIDSRDMYLCAFYNCKISASGEVNNVGGDPAYAVKAMDNSNGLLFSNCRMTGGGAGGVASIGRSYTIKFDSCVFESSKFGVRAGYDPDTGYSGSVNALTLDNCQWENCGEDISLGEVFQVNGVTMNNILITNPLTGGNVSDNAIILGRVQNLSIDAIQFDTTLTTKCFKFLYDSVAAGAGSLAWIERSSIRRVDYKRIGSGNEFDFAGFPAPASLSRLSSNEFEIGELTGQLRSYTSPAVTCSAGLEMQILHPTALFGFSIDRVEIINATGLLDGDLEIGSTVSFTGVMDKDLSTVSPSVPAAGGYADISGDITGPFGRADSPLRLRVVAGALSTTFQVRVTFLA